MHTNEDLRALHRIAVLTSVDLVSTVTVDDLPRATPCAGWSLADLLTHMTAQHRGFAAAARGHGADEAVWQTETIGEQVATDPAGAYAVAAAEVIDAFAGDGVLEAPFVLPELGGQAAFPGAHRRSAFTTSTTSCTAGMWPAHWAAPMSSRPAWWLPRCRWRSSYPTATSALPATRRSARRSHHPSGR